MLIRESSGISCCGVKKGVQVNVSVNVNVNKRKCKREEDVCFVWICAWM